MHPQSEALAEQFIADFWAANHEITWLAIEEERSLWLDDRTLLVGRVDARGLTSDGKPFFADWKTKGAWAARRMAEEKIKWRTNPQALTYGVLIGGETRRFMVRWALKTDPPQTAFEWYEYTQAELDHWHGQLVGVANEIREWRAHEGITWRTNRTNCYRYGVGQYACPFVHDCPNSAAISPTPRIPHSKTEQLVQLGELPGVGPETVVLSSSRVSDYLECPESYRRKWEGLGHNSTSEAMDVGTDFHALVGAHLTSLVGKQ